MIEISFFQRTEYGYTNAYLRDELKSTIASLRTRAFQVLTFCKVSQSKVFGQTEWIITFHNTAIKGASQLKNHNKNFAFCRLLSFTEGSASQCIFYSDDFLTVSESWISIWGSSKAFILDCCNAEIDEKIFQKEFFPEFSGFWKERWKWLPSIFERSSINVW